MAITNQTSGATSLEERLLAKGYKPKEQGGLEDRLLAKGYKPKPVKEVPQEVGVLEGLAKSLGQGAVDTLDLLASTNDGLPVYLSQAEKALMEEDIGDSILPSAALKNAGVNLEVPESSNPLVNIGNKIARTASGFATFPLGGGARAGVTGAKFGGISGILKEIFGLSDGAADVTTAVGSLGKPLAVGGVTKLAKSLNPLKQKNIDEKVLQANNDLGTGLPIGLAVDDPVFKGIERAVRNTPFISTQYNSKFPQAGQRVGEVISDQLEQVGPKQSPIVQRNIERLYENFNEVAKGSDLKGTPDSVLKIYKELMSDRRGTESNKVLEALKYLERSYNKFLTKKVKEVPEGNKELQKEIKRIIKDVNQKNRTTSKKNQSTTNKIFNTVEGFDYDKLLTSSQSVNEEIKQTKRNFNFAESYLKKNPRPKIKKDVELTPKEKKLITAHDEARLAYDLTKQELPKLQQKKKDLSKEIAKAKKDGRTQISSANKEITGANKELLSKQKQNEGLVQVAQNTAEETNRLGQILNPLLKQAEKDAKKVGTTIRREPKEVSADQLSKFKMDINDTIKGFSGEDGKKARDLLKRINGVIKEDIERIDPRSSKALAEADSYAQSVYRRRELESLFEATKNPSTGEYRVSSLASLLNSPESRKEILDIAGSSVNEETLNNLAMVTRKLAKNGQSFKEKIPSGISLGATAAGTVATIAGLLSMPIATITGLGLTGVAQQLVTNQKLAQKLIDFSNKPTKSTSEAFIKAFEGATKMSALNVSKQLNKSEEEERGKLLKKIRGGNESK